MYFEYSERHIRYVYRTKNRLAGFDWWFEARFDTKTEQFIQLTYNTLQMGRSHHRVQSDVSGVQRSSWSLRRPRNEARFRSIR